ncbi:hypothetical protein DPMN_068837 [Dreissena polymorpha]|uniref:Uncharacterized protein n=1 Tax=Dreissena polymorpha TaxID=45954 RepID=A0A9D3Z2C9_DREPO|nr:hypothetical protein DPMN_068837 [Dreissena polymorpha]
MGKCELFHCNITSVDHEVKSTMRDNDMSSCVEDAVSEFKNILRTYRITTDLNNTCTFDVGSDSPGLWETFPGQNANYLSLNITFGLQV